MKKPLFINRSVLMRTANIIFAVIGIVSCLYSSSPAAMAATPNQVHTYLNSSPAYDPDACAPGSSDGGVATATGPAADLLKKQTKLDGKWVDLIIKDAGDAGADPLAMASLLFWENRSFPAYKTSGWASDPNVGSGPWQIVANTWPSGAGPYSGAQDPVVSTKVAANIVKSYGGSAGISLGTIKQNFSKSVALKTMATLAKNYNAGQATWRDPGVADWGQSGRAWYKPGGVNWGDFKNGVIDDYVAGMTYIYYQIATGTQVSYKDNDSYVKESLSKESVMKNFKWSPNGGSTSTTTGATADAGSTKPTIVLDPGHAPATNIKVDPASNIAVIDSNNMPERDQTWTVAKDVEKQLTAAGYNVLITKKSSDDGTTNLKARADFAAQHNAALGISIHTTPSAGNGVDNAVYVPKVGEYRFTSDGKDKKYYNNQDLADKDLAAAKKMAAARSAAMDNTKVDAGPYGDLIGFRDTSTGGLVSKGNVLITDYFATTPWVYNEQAQDTTGSINAGTMAKYATGIVNGVKAIVPVSGAASDGSTCDSTGADVGNAAVQGDIVKTALNYAWPNNGKHPGVTKSAAKPSYQEAEPKYNGSTGHNEFTDCGVFVATVMRASGVDKNYPVRGTGVQLDYVSNHPDKYTHISTASTSGLQPGDIFIVNAGGQGHTYLYTGNYKGDDGKTYNAAAASLDGHVPEADMTYFSQHNVPFTIWRHK